MSDQSFDLREQIVRIDRDLAETEKLIAEARTFSAEHNKLAAEAANSWVARFVTPAALVIAAIGAVIAALPVLARAFGHACP